MTDIRNMGILAGVCLFLGAAAWQGFVLVPRSRKFRSDLEPGDRLGSGSSPLWQLNVYNLHNYRQPGGRTFFRKLITAAAIQIAGGLLIVIFGVA